LADLHTHYGSEGAGDSSGSGGSGAAPETDENEIGKKVNSIFKPRFAFYVIDSQTNY
jgi:hypothetical protein